MAFGSQKGTGLGFGFGAGLGEVDFFPQEDMVLITKKVIPMNKLFMIVRLSGIKKELKLIS
jgi:hypothetical protein